MRAVTARSTKNTESSAMAILPKAEIASSGRMQSTRFQFVMLITVQFFFFLHRAALE